MVEIVTLCAQFGIAGVCIGYFIWRDKQREAENKERDKAAAAREAAMTQRIQMLEDRERAVLIGLVSETKDALNAFAAAWRGKPCMAMSEPAGERERVRG